MIRVSYDISNIKDGLGAWKAHRQNYYSPHRCHGIHSLDRVSYSIRIPSCADDILQANSIFYRTAWFRHCHILVSEFYSRALLAGQTLSDTRVGVLVTTNSNLVKPVELV